MNLITRFRLLVTRAEYLDSLRPPSQQDRLEAWKERFDDTLRREGLDEQGFLSLEMRGLQVKRNFKWLQERRVNSAQLNHQ